MTLNELNLWLQKLLKPELYKDHCLNGLLVEAAPHVHSVVTGVSFCMELIEEAQHLGADCIIVHHPHGFWDNQTHAITGQKAKKISQLIKNGISLFGYHLPLDGHPEIGNNAGIAKALECTLQEGFMRSGQTYVGWIARFAEPISCEELHHRVSQVFGLEEIRHALLYGSDVVQDIAICSGSGASGIEEALALGAQAYLTGELRESSPIIAQEERIHLFACGHHRTEIYGPAALATRIRAELGIPAVFADISNPV